jgi:hypothetical protein
MVGSHWHWRQPVCNADIPFDWWTTNTDIINFFLSQDFLNIVLPLRLTLNFVARSHHFPPQPATSIVFKFCEQKPPLDSPQAMWMLLQNNKSKKMSLPDRKNQLVCVIFINIHIKLMAVYIRFRMPATKECKTYCKNKLQLGWDKDGRPSNDQHKAWLQQYVMH